MAEKALFDRQVRLVIATKVAEDYKSLSADVLEIRDLRVKFTIKKTSTKEPNTAEVIVSNLSPTHRAALQTKGVKFLLEAGYTGTGVKLLFKGDVRTIDHVREGPTWNTTIKSGDGERAFQFARLNESFTAKTPLSQVVKKVGEKLGLGLGNLSAASATLTGTYENGLVVSGPVSRELDKLLVGTGLEWSIQDEQLTLLRPTETSGQEIPDISPDSGLIGSPEFGSPLKKGMRPLLRFKCLINGNLKPGSVARLTSERFPAPVFVRAVKVEHTGDTSGGDWYTNIEGWQK